MRERGAIRTAWMRLCGGLAAAALSTERAESDAPTGRPIDGIRDNSFLIEEAYNQEAGVVQHIWTARFGAYHRGAPSARTWDLSFTQEWPVFTQTHQFSYTIPNAFVDEVGEHQSGVGDLLLNYRYQWLMDEGATPAFSPRFSVILPTGDEERGFGGGDVGYQVNLPISKTLGDRWYFNLNAGATYQPGNRLRLSDGRRSDKLDLLSFNVGASAIYAVTDTFHLLVEAVWNSNEELEEEARLGTDRPFVGRARAEDVVISPGVRWAWNLPGEVQIVPGLAFPIGLSEDALDYAVFFYFSVEHGFLRTGGEP